MSHKHHNNYNNYNNYTNYSKPQVEPVVEPEVAETVEAVTEPVVEETVEPVVEEVIEPVVETVEPVIEEVEEETDEIIGVVTDCVKLNVRKEPSLDTDILAVIKLGDEVMVDIFGSTDEFYKVTTAAGVEGYCIKNRINIY